jgi:zinc protease
VTSGHATERDWMIGFRYKNGFFKHENGRLYGLDTQGRKFPIDSPSPKVYLPVGNCLMGHIDRADCMALSWMNSAEVLQMTGYTVPSWYGYSGWGCLDYFLEQPGRFTLTEAFFANQAALIHRLETCFPGQTAAEIDPSGRTSAPLAAPESARKAGLGIEDARGLLYDRDFVAFYGDPAWEARMGKGDCAWEQTLSAKEGTWTFEIQPKRGEKSFALINKNGSQRGGRPLIEFLPKRLKNIDIIEGSDLHPVITDNFILVPNPRECEPGKTYRITFRADPIK